MTKETFDMLFNEYHHRLVYFAKSMIGDVFAEDVVADAYCKVWELRDRLNDTDNLSSFLYEIVKNSCKGTFNSRNKKYIRNYHAEKDDSISEDHADSLLIKAELMAAITDKYETLPPVTKKVFDLIYLDDLSYKEVAPLLNMAENTVAQHKKKIKKLFNFDGISILMERCWVVSGRRSGLVLSKRFKK